MRCNWLWIAAAACSLAVAPVLAANGTGLNPRDYAYQSQLVVDGSAALYAVKLNEEVYQLSVRADLSDLRVINGLNEEVPVAIRRPVEPRAQAAEFDPLPLFPLRGSARAPSDALKLQLRAAGASIDLTQQAQKSGIGVTAYLLDVRGPELPVAALRLSWPAQTQDFSSRLKVEWSDDLTLWQVEDLGLPIINLHYAGQSFVRAEVKLSARKTSFLRLSWMDQVPPDLILTAVEGQRQSSAVETTRQWVTAAAGPSSHPGDYDFDLRAHVPVDRLNVKLPELNTIVEAQLLARGEQSTPWQSVGSARLYRLKAPVADEISNAPVTTALTSARYWRMHITAAGGLGSTTPTLQAGWLADELLFLARGPAPFQLLYGNATAPANGRAALDLASLPAREGSIETHAAELGPMRRLGADERLKAAAPPVDWKRLVLWSVLVAGVATLLAMILRLARSLR